MRILFLFFVVLFTAAPLAAMPGHLSKPDYVAPEQSIPAPVDKAYPGTMRLTVDASDTSQGIFRITQIIPVDRAGRMTLLYPEWLPGNHAPRGEIEKVTGLTISANGTPLQWTRDNVDVYAFHIDVPEGTDEVTVRFLFNSATRPSQGRIVMAPSMLNLRWHQVSVYPAGYFVRQIPVVATAVYPDGWQDASALRAQRRDGSTVTYRETDYDTLVDSPVFAGRNFLAHRLTSRVNLNIVADDSKYLKAEPDQIAKHAKLVRESEALFGSHPYDRYDFLLALTDEMGGIGIEHHRSSENGVEPQYFTDWESGPGRRNLLPHEIVHAWIGKYKRPQGMFTPDFKQPMRDDLLWIYEGQTQFWGYVLGARSGLFSQRDTRDALATIAADLELRKGRAWRPLIDTTHDPIIAARKPKPWTTWQRAEDYYNEGMMIWLEADQIIRRDTDGKKSLEDFARNFFKSRNGDWGVVTYEYAEVIAALEDVHAFPWREFFDERVYRTTDVAPLNGLTLGGYRLAWQEQPTPFILSDDKRRKSTNLSWSIGLWVDNKGMVSGVVWDSPAFRAGLKAGLTISAVNGKAFSIDALKQAIADNADGNNRIELFAKNGEQYKNFLIDYSGGLRYPVLEKTVEGESGLDRLMASKTN